jgi:IS30 family transposase
MPKSAVKSTSTFPRKFTHFSLEERRKIAVWLKDKPRPSFEEMGRRLGRPGKTVSAEINRHGGLYAYDAARAQKKARKARTVASRQRRLLEQDSLLCQEVEARIGNGESPALISRILRLRGIMLCAETIYQHIYRDRLEKHGQLNKKMIHPRSKRRAKGRILKGGRGRLKNQKPLTDRPVASTERTEIGHVEADTIHGPGTACLLTVVDRKLRQLFALVLPDRTGETIKHGLEKITRQAAEIGLAFKSLTIDNGKEFALHEDYGNMFPQGTFFGEPHRPWQRGQIEERNRMLRWSFPKGTDFSKVTQADVDTALDRINNRPMACLKFSTPSQAFRVS